VLKIYTQDGRALDAVRERDILSSLFDKGIIENTAVSWNGTAHLIDLRPGRWMVAGVIIDDDEVYLAWRNLANVSPGVTGSVTFWFWGQFNPMTDDTPTYGVTSVDTSNVPNFSAILALYASPFTVVFGSAVYAGGETSANLAVWARAEPRLRDGDLASFAANQTTLDFKTVRYSPPGIASPSGTPATISWRNMQVCGEAQRKLATVTGDATSEVDPWDSDTMEFAIPIPVPISRHGFLFIRMEPGELPLNVTDIYVNTRLRYVDFNEFGIADSQGDYGDLSGAWTSSGEWPEVVERANFRVLGIISRERIAWINGSVTVLGRASSQEFGDTINTLSVKSTAAATNIKPGADGAVDLDAVIPGIVQLVGGGVETYVHRSALTSANFVPTVNSSAAVPEDEGFNIGDSQAFMLLHIELPANSLPTHIAFNVKNTGASSLNGVLLLTLSLIRPNLVTQVGTMSNLLPVINAAVPTGYVSSQFTTANQRLNLDIESAVIWALDPEVDIGSGSLRWGLRIELGLRNIIIAPLIEVRYKSIYFRGQS